MPTNLPKNVIIAESPPNGGSSLEGVFKVFIVSGNGAGQERTEVMLIPLDDSNTNPLDMGRITTIADASRNQEGTHF